MGHYRANTKDISFVTKRVFPPSQSVREAFPEFDEETFDVVVEEVAHLAETVLADTFAVGDRRPAQYNPETFSVTLDPEFAASYRRLMDAEFWRLDLPEELGGSSAPPSLRWAVAEMLLGANPPLYFYMAGPLFAAIVHALGTEEQKRWAKLIADKQWGATMVLTEPDAGSDVGAGRTTATLQEDGSWHIEGVKRFITSGDHDLSENIVHLVLARPVGIEGVGGPGTKGLSMFLVPKFHVDLDSGNLGERNGVYATNMEHKHGMNASATCELSFGLNGKPAVGWLIGDVHDGIAQMFHIIEYARMMVGTKAIATLSTGYLTALEYAKTRVQGQRITAMDRNSERVPIIQHSEVRNMLLLQKCYAEGLRALVFYTASWQDRIAAADKGITNPDDPSREEMHQINDLLLPVVKGVGSERSYEMLVLALQTLGGSGYLQDYPIEQYMRDAKIDTVYEGATIQQAMDLIYRKVLKNRFAAFQLLMADLEPRVHDVSPELQGTRQAVEEAAARIQLMLTSIGQMALDAQAGNPSRLDAIGLNSTRVLYAFGDWLVGAMLLIEAEAASRLVENGDPAVDTYGADYLKGKIAAAQFFSSSVLPRLESDLKSMELLQHFDVGALPEEAF